MISCATLHEEKPVTYTHGIARTPLLGRHTECKLFMDGGKDACCDLGQNSLISIEEKGFCDFCRTGPKHPCLLSFEEK